MKHRPDNNGNRDQRPPVKVDIEAQADEDFLDHEAPSNDRRARISPEYKGTSPRTPPELSMNPDGQDTYSEEKGAPRARGENPKGSSQHESQVKTLGK